MKILILANTRFKGGLSGGDAIYENFKKFWPCEFSESNCYIEYSPFFLCYLQRVIVSVCRALFDRRRFDIVYSSSDFLPDSIPGFIYKLRGRKWIAGFYLTAFKENPIHFYSQKVVRKLIQLFADMVIVTNPTMYHIFPNKKKTWINGGINLKLAGLSIKPKIYDAVFCGRIHPSKGIDELLNIWDDVRKVNPNAKLAIIGDGDLGVDYIKHKLFAKHGLKQYNGIDLLGYMGDERYEIYKQSKIVFYPTPFHYDHFSMAPVEAMACGCPMVAFNIPTIQFFKKEFKMPCITMLGDSWNDEPYFNKSLDSYNWAQQFDYEQQALRVYSDIKKELFNEGVSNGLQGNGGDGRVQSIDRSHTDYP